jgi:SPP1 family phage portal protein
MVEAEAYYRNRTDIQNKTVSVANRTNSKIEHPILKKLVDQKANYLLAKPWVVSTEDNAYGDALNKIFDQSFRRKIKGLGRGAVKSGIAWIQPYFADGALKFMRIPAMELIPHWKDSEHIELSSFIRFYELTEYIGIRKTSVLHAEFWFSGGVRWFVSDSYTGTAAAVELHVDTSHGNEGNEYTEPHFSIGDKAYNWDTPPIAWVRYNEEELPLYYFIKELIDDYNWQTSVIADVLRDVPDFTYILRNYGGADLAMFLKDLRENRAIKVDGDGGVDKLSADLNIDAVMAFLDKQRRDIYDFAAAVDTKDPELGNASGTAINFRYMDLDADCDGLAQELKDTFRRLKLFIDVYLQATGQGNFANAEFDIIFNMDLPVNETDIINNARTSVGIVSNRTILSNHPWVEDVEAELAELDKEREESQSQLMGGAYTLPGANNDPDAVNDDGEE